MLGKDHTIRRYYDVLYLKFIWQLRVTHFVENWICQLGGIQTMEFQERLHWKINIHNKLKSVCSIAEENMNKLYKEREKIFILQSHRSAFNKKTINHIHKTMSSKNLKLSHTPHQCFRDCFHQDFQSIFRTRQNFNISDSYFSCWTSSSCIQ